MLLAYGIFQVLRGWHLGHPTFVTLRDFAFNCYPAYLFLGVWVGLRWPGRLAGFFRVFAWVNALYGIAFVLLLGNLGWVLAGASQQGSAAVLVFGQPEHAAVALLALLCFESDLRRVWHLLLMNAFVLLGMQIRAAWLAFFLALLLWGYLTRRFRRLMWVAAAVAIILGAMYVGDFQIPGPQTRGGYTISTRELAGRALAPIAPDVAANYTDYASNYEGTAAWRTLWWASIWASVHETPQRALLGHGYGYALGDLVPYLAGAFLRTPHNVFFYVLGYTGWLGVLLFLAFQLEVLRLLESLRRQSGQAFGVVFWLTLIVYACFTASFEAPYVAIPFYLVVGWVLAPLLVPETNRVVLNQRPIDPVGVSAPALGTAH
jgi:O-antigen ligase